MISKIYLKLISLFSNKKDKEDITIKVECPNDDIIPYGWTIEKIYKNNGNVSHALTSSRKIYHSRESAIDALSKMKEIYSHLDYEIIALYKMDKPQLRDYKINRIVNHESEKTYEIKGWKLKEDYINKFGVLIHKKGSIFIQLKDGTIIKSGTPNNPTLITSIQFINNNQLEEIEIKDEKWLYPHLLKELRGELSIDLDSSNVKRKNLMKW